MPDTRITNLNGVARRHGQRVSASGNWAFSAAAFSRLTMAEIVTAAGLPMRFVRGDVEHEETTEALDGMAMALRNAA